MEHYRIFACEGLDGTGKTTYAKLLAQQTGSAYLNWTDNNPLARFRKQADRLHPALRFTFYTALSFGTHKEAQKNQLAGDVYVDRTILSTIAYHKALGVSDAWMALIPHALLDQIDQMLYFTAAEDTRLERMQKRLGEGKALSTVDAKSLLIGRKVDEAYRTIMPHKTLVVATDDKKPQEVVDEVKQQLYT